VVNDLRSTNSASQTNEVQDNSSDLTQLADAAKRADEARTKENAARVTRNSAESRLASAWDDGYEDAPQQLKDDLKKAEDTVFKSEQTRDKWRATQAAAPNDDNAFMLAAAEQDAVEADRAWHAAEQKVIDSFNPDKLKAYNEADAAYHKAFDEWRQAHDERRAAEEALEKLKQTAGMK
jgi:hypothetical protein